MDGPRGHNAATITTDLRPAAVTNEFWDVKIREGPTIRGQTPSYPSAAFARGDVWESLAGYGNFEQMSGGWPVQFPSSSLAAPSGEMLFLSQGKCPRAIKVQFAQSPAAFYGADAAAHYTFCADGDILGAYKHNKRLLNLRISGQKLDF
ncbi:hypothetical protein GPALN_002050 [Globodera pallida]|nr:hypothetical protein GPALN_002050 [Globodera pallida]